MNISKINIGDQIEYRPNFGSGIRQLGTVTDIDEKNDKGIVYLYNGTWAYAHQVDRVVKTAKSATGAGIIS